VVAVKELVRAGVNPEATFSRAGHSGRVATYLGVSWQAVDCSYPRRCVGRSPGGLWKWIGFLLDSFLEQVFDWTGHFLHLARGIELVHLVVFVTNFIGQTTSPRLYLVEFVLLFIITALANVDLLVRGETFRATAVIASDEHDKASINHLVNGMIAILTRLYNFVLVEVSVIAMDSLLGSVVPACVDPLVAVLVLPSTIELRDDGLSEIICILNVYPVTLAP